MIFEEFLETKHFDQYEGFKDNISDDFESWSELEFEEMCKLVDEYAEEIKKDFKKMIESEIEDIKLEGEVFYGKLNQFELLNKVLNRLKEKI